MNFCGYGQVKAIMEVRLHDAKQRQPAIPSGASSRTNLQQRFCSGCGRLLIAWGERLLAAAQLPTEVPEKQVIFE